MATIAITINGVARTTMIREVRYSAAVNAIGTASFRLSDPTGVYVPDDGHAVVITVGGVDVWRGEIVGIEHGFYSVNAGIDMLVTCHDYNARPAREPINAIIPEQTLKATLQMLTAPGAQLNAQGISLAAGQATGPTLGVITAAFWNVETLLNHLSLLSGYMWRVDGSGVLEMWLPAAKISGVTLSLANANLIDFTWSRHRFDYRNIQGVLFGPSGDRVVTETFYGDGASLTHDLGMTVTAQPTSITINPGGTVQPVGTVITAPATWMFDASQGSYGGLVNTGAALTGSQSIVVSYTTTGPNYVTEIDAVEVAARGRWGKVVAAPEIEDILAARDLGQALIRQNKERPKIGSARTSATGIDPGETVGVLLSTIGISETMLVQTVDVELQDLGNSQVDSYTNLKAFGGAEAPGTNVSLWQQIIYGDSPGAGSGSIGGTSGGSGGGTTTTVIAGGMTPLHFGGWKQVNPPTWRSTAGNGVAFDAPEGAEHFLTAERVSGSLRLHIHLKTDAGANGTVSARLFNETTGAAASDWTTGVTAATLTYVDAVVALAPGENVYKLQLRVSGSAHATANVSYWNATLVNRP